MEFRNIQIEIDLTIEFQGTVVVFAGKNGKPDSFNVSQIYLPFLYYYNANQRAELKGKIKNVYCVYVVHEKGQENDTLKLWKYTFENPLDITTIKLLKSTSYKLKGEISKNRAATTAKKIALKGKDALMKIGIVNLIYIHYLCGKKYYELSEMWQCQSLQSRHSQ